MAAVVERSPTDTSKAMTQGGNPNDFPLTPARAQEVVQFLDHDDFDELAMLIDEYSLCLLHCSILLLRNKVFMWCSICLFTSFLLVMSNGHPCMLLDE